jgi:hypothetical protein
VFVPGKPFQHNKMQHSILLSAFKSYEKMVCCEYGPSLLNYKIDYELKQFMIQTPVGYTLNI